MVIAHKYTELLKNIRHYTNEEYLALQIWQLRNVFSDELVAIKNANREYVAFSTSFGLEFGFDEHSLGQQFKNISQFALKLREETDQQEQNIIVNKTAQDSICYTSINKISNCYIMRRRPLINPYTQDAVGIITFCIKFDMFRQRSIFMRTFARKVLPNILINETDFTELQQQIITSLFLGFHQRKEIAELLNSVTNGEVNDILVKNTLQSLYNKHNCRSTYELIHIIAVNKGMAQNIPGILIQDGSYPIEK